MQALPVGIIRQKQLCVLHLPCASRVCSSVLQFSQPYPIISISLPRCLCKDWSHEGSAGWILHSSTLKFVLLTSFSPYCPHMVPCLGALRLLGCCDAGNGQPSRQHFPNPSFATCVYAVKAGAVLYSLTLRLCWVVVSPLQLRKNSFYLPFMNRDSFNILPTPQVYTSGRS